MEGGRGEEREEGREGGRKEGRYHTGRACVAKGKMTTVASSKK